MILTKQEAEDILKLDDYSNYPTLDIILPAIDDCLKTATGKEWGTETEIDPLAKMIASVLLVRWFGDPGMIGKLIDSSMIGLITQLKSKI